jgi:type I restriction enzyme, S subunit
MTWTCGPALDPFYLLVALRVMQPELRRLMYGSTHKTIYMPDLHALRIPLPALEDQLAIVHKARERFATAWPLRDELVELDAGLVEYREALITEAVTGRLDVTFLSYQQMDESVRAAMEGAKPKVASA